MPRHADAWTSQVNTEQQRAFVLQRETEKKPLVLSVSIATLWSSKNTSVQHTESTESSANHRSLHCSLEETHLPGSRVRDPVSFRHIPSVRFPWALLFTEERQIEPAELNWMKRTYVYRSRFYGCLSTTLSRFHLIWIHIATKNHLLSLALPGKVSSLESLLPHRMYQEKKSWSETVLGFSELG